MKVIGIMGAMDLEIELIHNKMKVDESLEIAGFKFYEGEIDDKKIILTSCGIGKVNAACCTQILIDKYKVDCIINTGIAGGLHNDVNTCDVVISKEITHHDVRKSQMISCYPNREYFEGDKELIEIAIRACELIGNTNYHVGRIVSGEAFISDKDLKNQIIKDFAPHCVEMEGSAIGHVSHINKIPFVVIRSISDNADEEAHMSYESFEKIAAEQSASIILSMIKLI